MGGAARSVVGGAARSVVGGAARSVVEAVKPVAGALRVATKTLEFVFLQVGEKQANQMLYQ